VHGCALQELALQHAGAAECDATSLLELQCEMSDPLELQAAVRRVCIPQFRGRDDEAAAMPAAALAALRADLLWRILACNHCAVYNR
jgi:hypothetical protein